jgi:NAD dependent epimerase/dehydratase family enzyme
MGVGGVMGSGDQYWPWIHVKDEVGIMEHIIEKGLEGVFLGISPEVSYISFQLTYV